MSRRESGSRRLPNLPSALSSQHYYQGGYDLDFVGGLDPKHECPICLLCQRDPHQTSCGHRFCYSCIMTWLNEGKTCPDDNCSLGEGDIFADAMAHREIMQLRVRCPNTAYGCKTVLHLADVESHLTQCDHRQQISQPTVQESVTCKSCGELVPDNSISKHESLICPNTPVACLFAMAGCTHKVTRKNLQGHLANQTVHHMQLLADKLNKLQQIQQVGTFVDPEDDHNPSSLPSSPVPALSREQGIRFSGSNLHNNGKLLRELYQRIVQLEQKNCQQEIHIQRLETKMSDLSMKNSEVEAAGRYCNGAFTWRISNFSDLHQKMRTCHSFVVYSHGFYSSVFGYKMCLRSNINIIAGEEHLGIFLHLMQGDNDDSQVWPFVGRVTLTIFNQKEGLIREHLSETMDTMPGLAAFERPSADRNPRGFGFQEFIRVNGIYTGGFIHNDTLLVKVKVKCSGE